MSQEEMQDLCLKKNLLLDSSLFEIFSSFENPSLVGLLLEKIRALCGRRFITFSLLSENKEKIRKVIDEVYPEGEKGKKEICEKLNFFSKRVSEKKREEEKEGSSVKVLSSFPVPGKKIEVKDFIL